MRLVVAGEILCTLTPHAQNITQCVQVHGNIIQSVRCMHDTFVLISTPSTMLPVSLCQPTKCPHRQVQSTSIARLWNHTRTNDLINNSKATSTVITRPYVFNINMLLVYSVRSVSFVALCHWSTNLTVNCLIESSDYNVPFEYL